jgi:hypothetical protein
MNQMLFPQNRSWDILREDGITVNFKMGLSDLQSFTFDAWIVESGQHVGVHSGHPHRPLPHLQISRSRTTPTDYWELPKGQDLRLYAERFETAVRQEMRVNAWQVFS